MQCVAATSFQTSERHCSVTVGFQAGPMRSSAWSLNQGAQPTGSTAEQCFGILGRMKVRRRGSAQVPLDRIEKLFVHRRNLERQLERLDDVIATMLMRLATRNIHMGDVARRLARALGEVTSPSAIRRLDARLRQARARARRRNGAPLPTARAPSSERG